MLQSAAALFGAAFTGFSCYALGRFVLSRFGWRAHLRPGEELPLAALLGAACLHSLMFAIFALHVAYWPVVVGVPVLFIALGGGLQSAQGFSPATAASGAEAPRGLKPTLHWIAWGIAAVYLIVYVVNAWAPESSADGSSYHLGLLARYLRNRGFEHITTNMYAALGAGVEMVFAPAFVIGRHSAAALTHLLFATALAVAIFRFGQRIGKPSAGLTAAVLFWVTPVVGRDATFAYIDVGAAAAVFGAFYWLEIWLDSQDPRLLWPVGLMAGYAFASKYTAISIVAFAVVSILWRARDWRPLLPFSAAAFLMAGPWLIRNWLWYQNPLAPMANAMFPNPYFHIAAQDDWASWLRHYDLSGAWKIPWELTTNGSTLQGLLGPFFLAIPIALLGLRFASGRRLLAAAAFVLATYPANIGTRFLIPSLPFLLLAFALAVSNVKFLLIAAMLLHGVASWPDVTDRYARYTWRIYIFPWRAALRIDSQDFFLNKYFPNYRVARMIEGNVPKGESVFSIGGTADAYTTREVRVSFQSASNLDLSDTFHLGWDPSRQPLIAEVFHFPAVEAQGIRLIETAAANEQWSVHELRFFHAGVEVSRRPGWRLQSHPNPWQVGYAFDNSLVTRWRTWQATPANSSMEAMFDQMETIDEVRVITSPDFEWTRLKVQVNAAGKWQDVDASPRPVELGEPRQVRREAIHELTMRGIHYILMQPDDPGYIDVAEDPEGWGLRKIADTGGAVLYRTVW